MKKVNRKVRNWFYCLWNGHQYKRQIWPGYGNAPFDLWICKVCGADEIRGNK